MVELNLLYYFYHGIQCAKTLPSAILSTVKHLKYSMKYADLRRGA